MSHQPATLNQIYFGALDRFHERPVAMRVKRDGEWRDISFAQLAERVEGISAGLAALGIRRGDNVALLSENRPEWAMADLACLAHGAVDVPIYPTSPTAQIGFILQDSGAVAAFVSTAEQLAKLLECQAVAPSLRHIVVFDSAAALGGALTLDALIARAPAGSFDAAEWRRRALAVRADDVATVIYTSGTTGDPKGVVLSHGNIASNVVGGLEVLPLGETDECLSFLPLSHIFERMAGQFCMLQAGAVINYATSIETVAAEMAEVRPTVVLSVPRLYEKIYARVLDAALAGSPVKRRIFSWARAVGERWADRSIEREPIGPVLAAQYRLAHRLVFRKLAARVGGRLRFFVSGAAPLQAEIARFFYAAGLPVLEGYGLTETSPVITVNGLNAMRLGTVGRPITGVEIRIADDGEILTRGPHVMQGYFNKPEATAEVIDQDGWLHTGDIGVIDADGFLSITDRKKDLIVTAGGKNIAPQPLENRIKTSRFVGSAVMLGDRRKFPIVLIVPNPEALRAWAASQGMNPEDYAALLSNTVTAAMIQDEVDRLLHDRAHYELPKRVLLLADDFSIEGGELTPKLSIRRKVVEEKYRDAIEALYQDAEHDPAFRHHE